MSDGQDGTPKPAFDPLVQVRRSPMEMVCDIMGVIAEGPTKPTHILYKANMSWKVLSFYLEYLTGRGLVEKEEQGRKRSTYRLTPKGISILRLYDDLRLGFSRVQVYGSQRQAPEMVGRTSRSGSRASSSPW